MDNENKSDSSDDLPIDDLSSYMNPEPSVDISMPDIPIPTPESEQKVEDKVKDDCHVAFNFAFIGAGQALVMEGLEKILI